MGPLDTDSSGLRHLWAKSEPRHALWKHLLDAAAVSLALPSISEALGLSQEQVAFLVGLHDIGKADPSFQHQVSSFSAELVDAGFPITGDAPCRHERLSAGFAARLLSAELERSFEASISLAIAAHHGHWDSSSREVGRQYREAQAQLCHILREALHIDELSAKTPSDLSAFGMLIAGRIVLCDWIASNEDFFTDGRLPVSNDPAVYFAAARRVAEGWVTRLGLRREVSAGRPYRLVDCPRPVQELLLTTDIPPGLVIVEAPMGEGKTEAAWILGEKWRDQGYQGMYMALPTMATSDSLYARYSKDFLERLGYGRDVKLVHGMAWIRDETEPEAGIEVGAATEERSLAASWFRPTRRAMLAAHGVGTVDQAMLAGMNVRFGFLRLYGLAGRVLVIDEVHAYDAYMSAIIAQLLRWCACLRIPVVLLSATLSSAQKNIMIEAYNGVAEDPGPEDAYPLVTVVESGARAKAIAVAAFSRRRLKIEPLRGLLGDAQRTAAQAAELVRDGGCCCVVVNTVRQAQTIYRALAAKDSEKLLFHARFTAGDRAKIAQEVMTLFGKDRSHRPKRFVVVATQVVEQSLDVDFDHMISEIAPVDLLLQRSGRLHRHEERGRDPILHVLLPAAGSLDFGGTGYVYARKPLLRTVAILAETTSPEFQLPKGFRALIERCYGTAEWEQPAVPWEAIREADQEWQDDNRLLWSQAKHFVLREPQRRSFHPVENDPTGDDSDDGTGWRARTRLGAAESTALLVTESELRRLEVGDLPMREVRELYRRSVKLPGYLPVFSPASGFGAAVKAKGRLQGLLLLPADQSGAWRGVGEKGGCFEVKYDNKLGLLAGRTP